MESIDFHMQDMPQAETTPERLERVDLIRSLQLENAKLRAKVKAANAMRYILSRIAPRDVYESLTINEAITNYDRS